MKNEACIRAVAEEARKILQDYPHLKYYEAVIKAKEVLKDDSSTIQKQYRSNDVTGCGRTV